MHSANNLGDDDKKDLFGDIDSSSFRYFAAARIKPHRLELVALLAIVQRDVLRMSALFQRPCACRVALQPSG